MFGLGPFPRDVLVLALAPELDASFERLYAYAHDDAARRYPTPALAVALFGEPSPADDALGPDGSLARFGLLQPGDPEVSEAVTPLRLERRVARLLRAVDHDDGAGDVRLIPVRAVPAPEEVSAAAAPVIRALRTYAGGAAGQDGGRPAPAVNLVGGTRGQAHALAAAIARGLARSVHRPAALPSTADPRGCDAYLERESALR
ncbi:MAG: hypothetical protein GWN02_23195, partial [Gemmatimonadetes bacterium]|nr:hypothetical protein [Gemmatimonadota bacterium]